MIAVIAGASILAFVGMVLRDIFKRDRAVSLALLIWFALFSALASTSFFENNFSSFPPIQLRFTAALLVLLLASLFVPRTRKVWNTMPVTRLVSWHWVRAPMGVVFLLAAASGEIAPQFGERAGWGDLLAGVLAITYVFVPAIQKKTPTLLWNVIGLVDLLFAVVTALLTVSSPIQIYPFADQLRLLIHLPFIWVPGFLVPILVFSHILIFRRVIGSARGVLMQSKVD